MKVLKILAALLLPFAVTFLVIGMLSREFTYDNTVTIDRPVDHVWRVFTDVSRMKDWLLGLQGVEHLSGTPLAVGGRSKLVFVEGGEEIEVIETVTAVAPGELYVFDQEADPFTGSTEIRFTPRNGHTDLSARTTMRGRNVLWCAVLRLCTGMMTQHSDDCYAALKRIAEAD